MNGHNLVVYGETVQVFVSATEDQWKTALNSSNLKQSISIRRSEPTTGAKRAHENEESVIDSILKSEKNGNDRIHVLKNEETNSATKPPTKKQKKFMSKRG